MLIKTPVLSRYGFIDAVRGIAACAVMLQHSLYQSGLLGDFPGKPLTGFIPTWLELGETGVVAFFLVSGFVIPLSLEKTNDFGLFWLHRVLRIYPLYIAVYIISFVFKDGGDVSSVKELALNIISHIFLIQEYVKQENFVGGSWTLSLEAVWYVVISGLFLVSLNRRTTLLVIAAVLVSLVSQICCATGLHLPMGRLSMLVCCVFGLVCYRESRGGISVTRFRALAATLGITIVVNLFFGMYLFPAVHPTASFRMVIDSWGLAAIVFFVPYFTRNSQIWKSLVFQFLGRISYSIYLVHGVVLYVLTLTPLSGVVVMVITSSLTIALSTLTYNYVELPAIRYGHTFKAVVEPDRSR